MLRRRSKTPKIHKHVTPGPQATSRRRARPDVDVPPQLRVASAPRGEGVALVTGFDPFGGEQLNPSWEVCTRLPRVIGGLRIETLRVPCEFRRSIEVVATAIERHRPSLVVCLGQAGGRAHLSVERVAINVDDARAPDNGRAQPVDEPIAPGGPPAYFATLPIKAMAAAMRAAGAPTEVSNTAGTYVCNHLMYGVLHYLAERGEGPTRAGFIHMPYAEEQVIDKPGVPALSIAAMVRGIAAGIEAAAATKHDLRVSEGALS